MSSQCLKCSPGSYPFVGQSALVPLGIVGLINILEAVDASLLGLDTSADLDEQTWREMLEGIAGLGCFVVDMRPPSEDIMHGNVRV